MELITIIFTLVILYLIYVLLGETPTKKAKKKRKKTYQRVIWRNK